MHRTSSSQVKTERDFPPMSSGSDLDPLDSDTPPERYSSSGRPSSQSTLREIAHTRDSTTPTMSSDRIRTSINQSPSKQPSRRLDRHQQRSIQQQSYPKTQSPRIIRWLTSTIFPGVSASEGEQLLESQADEIYQLKKLLDQKEDVIKSMSENRIKDTQQQQRYFQDQWQHRETQIQRFSQEMKSQENDTIQRLQVQVQECASEGKEIHEKYNVLLRRQQEESFKQMETGRWLPREESRVLADFERIRTQMRTWAKSAAVKDIGAIHDIGEEQHASLMASLSRLAVLENHQLPRAFSTPKGPSLLLNALLAHDVYTSLFRSPFFFLDDEPEYGPTGEGLHDSLEHIYSSALSCKWEASSDRDSLLKYFSKLGGRICMAVSYS